MIEELQTKYGHVYKDTQLSLHRYHQSIVNLLDAVRQRKSNDHQLFTNILKTSMGIRDAILTIQTIQQKKLHLYPDAEPLRNMVCFKLNLQNGLPRIIIEDGSPLPPWKPTL